MLRVLTEFSEAERYSGRVCFAQSAVHVRVDSRKRVDVLNIVTGEVASLPPSRHHRTGIRKSITEFSTRSRYRLQWAAASRVSELRFHVTLTSRQHLSAADGKRALRRVLAEARACGCERYIWVLEFQRRGAAHFHLFTSHYSASMRAAWLAATGEATDEDAQRYAVRVESIPGEEVGQFCANIARYMVKYGVKAEQKKVPVERGVNAAGKVVEFQRPAWCGRFWGTDSRPASAEVSRDPAVVRVVRKWARARARVHGRRVKGAGSRFCFLRGPEESRSVFAMLMRLVEPVMCARGRVQWAGERAPYRLHLAGAREG